MKSYIIVYDGITESISETFLINGIDKFIILNERLAAIYVDDDYNAYNLEEIETIAEWQPSKPMGHLIQITNNLKTGESVSNVIDTEYVYNNPYSVVSGTDVVIAVIDSGIDYLHPDFINPDNTSKIISIWDQSGESEDSNLPFGREITNEQINKAILENDPTLTTDEIGTGTLAAGICCGRGNLNENYGGVARDSELIVVKVRQSNRKYNKNSIAYESSDFYAAIWYIIEKIKEVQKDLVINLTLAEMSTAQLKTNLLDTFSYLKKSGVVVVSGAGNEGNTDIHYKGKINPKSNFEDIVLQVGELENLEIIVFVKGPDKIGAQLISPAGETSYMVEYSPEFYLYSGKFNIEDTYYQMRFMYPQLESAGEVLRMYLRDVKPGVWIIRLIPDFIIDGEYDIYLPNEVLISKDTRFIDPNSYSTITYFAISPNVITVGGFNNKTESIWIGSSKGFVEERNIKPDIVAPAVDIIAPYINSSYNSGTGTGVSSSIVSGVIALLISNIRDETEFSRTQLFSRVLETYLMLGARQQEIFEYPNVTQGHGILDLKETMIQIANNLQ